MGIWLDSIDNAARTIHSQMAAAIAFAQSEGIPVSEAAAPYLSMLQELYQNDFALARTLDHSDLVSRFQGPAVDYHEPSAGIVSYALSELRLRVRQIAKAVVDLSNQPDAQIPPGLDPLLSGIAKGSLVIGIKIPDGCEQRKNVQFEIPESFSPMVESVRNAVVDLATVSRYVDEDSVSEGINDELPDPALRDALLVAASRLAPTGNRGIDRVQLIGSQSQAGLSSQRRNPDLTPNLRKVLRRAVASPKRVGRKDVFKGVMREVDLDARRFEIRNVIGIGTIRCAYTPEFDVAVKGALDSSVEISGNFESRADGTPRLVIVDSLKVILRPGRDGELI